MVTIKEIAVRAGVSVGTIDRVLHKRGRVSRETENKVKRIISDLDYKPNILAKSLSTSKIFQFGVLMPEISPDNHYWELAIRGINKAYQELKVHKINVNYYFYEGYSEESFKEAGKRVLTDQLDGLLIVPIIYKSYDDEFIRQIPAQLPYAFFNSAIPGANNITYIGQDSYQSGMLAGNLMLMMTQEAGSLVVLTMLHDDYHISKRQKGFEDYVIKHSDIKIKVYGAQRTEAHSTFQKLLEKIFSENDDLLGIYVTTALTYNVADYLQSNSCNKKIKVVGHDLTDENVYYLKQGLIHYLIGQRPESQGYEGIYSLYRHVVLKERVPPNLMMPMDIVTQMNVDFYQNQ